MLLVESPQLYSVGQRPSFPKKALNGRNKCDKVPFIQGFNVFDIISFPKNPRREITLACVGQEDDDHAARVFLLAGQGQGGMGGGARGDADEQSLVGGEGAGHLVGGLVGDADHLVDRRGVVGRGDETGADALQAVRAGAIAREDGGSVGLDGDDAGRRRRGPPGYAPSVRVRFR